MEFKFEKEFLERVEDKTNLTNQRETITEIELKELVKEYPKLTKYYIEYLKEIGSGNFRECQFKVQKYLFDLDDLGLSEHYDLKKGIKFFGDNYAGDFAGFDFNNSSELVIEFWHEDGTIYETGKNFKEYIREQMLIGRDGNDISE